MKTITLEDAVAAHKKLYDSAFKALAIMGLPDFSFYNDRQIQPAFAKLFAEYLNNREEVFAYMQEKIYDNSFGATSITPAEFDTGILGANVQFELKRGETVKKLVFGPYASPFEFLEK